MSTVVAFKINSKVMPASQKTTTKSTIDRDYRPYGLIRYSLPIGLQRRNYAQGEKRAVPKLHS